MKTVLTGNYAAAYAVKYSDVKVIAAYPITPQTQIAEKLSEMCAKHEMDAKYINVESEQSSMASCIGAASTGARTFTATSSQGLTYMHEMLHWSAGSRLPIVMVNVNRALAPAWSIWVDLTDSLSQRDTGWMQLYCKNNQEVFDSVVMAYKISEKVFLPTMINLDAFLLSHTSETIELPDDEKTVRDFLPGYKPQYKMDTDDPRAFGQIVDQNMYAEFRYKMQRSMQNAKKVIKDVCREFKDTFGREYGLIETYKTDDAEDIIVAVSTMAETASIAVDKLRESGKKVGMLRIRYFRPFPSEDIYKVIKGKKRVIVLDRDISFGAEGIFSQEIKSAVYGKSDLPQIYGYILGLGGRSVDPNGIINIYNSCGTEKCTSDRMVWGDVKL